MSTLSEIQQEPGVSDLPLRARKAFAAAIKYERAGKLDKAETWLEKAIKYEQQEQTLT